jgi:hypothetical protein
MSNWRKSTYSNGGGNACVEVASADGVMVRDTTNRGGSMLAVSAGAWQVFTSKITNALPETPSGAGIYGCSPPLRVRSGSAGSGDVEVARRCCAPQTLEQ